MKMDWVIIRKFFTGFIFGVTLFQRISLAQNQPNEIILTRIDNEEITVEEFLQRSEFTIRPNNFKDRNTTLNNLITEKILALEARHNKEISQSSLYQKTLNGIKEQLMRERLYDEVANNKVTLDANEIKNAYKLSMREYELEFFTIRNKELVQKVQAVIDSVPELIDEMFEQVGEILGEKPTHMAKYRDPDDEIIHKSLFANPVNIGAVIGPLKLSNGDHIIMKVLNWTDYPLISGEDQQIRWKQVKEKLHQTKANKLWRSYVAGVMKGKRIEFDKQSYTILSNWAMERYLNRKNNDTLTFKISEIPSANPDIDLGAPFFTINNRLWTVDDFRNELMSHPLVFRTTDLNSTNFKEQFKLAIVDMMRDHYLTQEAYKKKLDNNKTVKKTVKMWKDSFLARDQAKYIMDSALKEGSTNGNDNIGKLKYWESYLYNLQKKYSKSIYVNNKEFDKISLTKIDMFAWKPGVPYPVIVPEFPVFISSENLDYAIRNK